ncbi:hypothetical protein Daura_16290 [Dactylosporangium aurantiacum]|uniref:Uncharacterized protein n=1 Tax=Dactylosporangium aurantiacum TaxID=35754 RepID=A0A9Q9MFU4_9ACTN|nr:hypothetical protein [Dactylosporangium aurantiacum]UWZ57578.1 hypothetical protein Daura_16290 [Dactylosporangium aurantiacum]
MTLIVLLTTAGCARPGRVDAASDATPGSPRPAPSRSVAACADPDASPAPATGAPGTPGTATAGTPGSEDQFQRDNQANRAFRQRGVLPPQAMAAVQPCVAEVRAGLDRLRAEGRFDGPAIERVLTDAGLAEVESRRAGRLDTGDGSGLLFCGNSGFGYVFGQHGPAGTTVDAGGAIADGGCLPAPD